MGTGLSRSGRAVRQPVTASRRGDAIQVSQGQNVTHIVSTNVQKYSLYASEVAETWK